MAPAFNSQVVPISEIPDEVLAAAERQPVVLIVDDEKIIADSLATILSRAGYLAYSAYEGETALALAAKLKPELLLSDVAMPGMNGVQLAVLLSEVQPQCKVLLISGHATEADLLRGRDGGHHFPLLSKPIHPEEVIRQVGRCLNMKTRAPRVIEPIGRGFFQQRGCLA